MRIILAKTVNQWFLNEKDVSEEDLLQAADQIMEGVYDASLGRGIYKKRISSKSGKGKSGGSRLLVAYKKESDLFFMYAFNKNERDNIGTKEKEILKIRAKIYFEMAETDIAKAVNAKLFYEIKRG